MDDSARDECPKCHTAVDSGARYCESCGHELGATSGADRSSAFGAPQVGAVGLWDGQDLITGVTFTKEPTWPTIKAGTFGDHWWVGANYTFNMR